ncbi:class I SAM-dependent methyltransferase [Waterburya agarophytonicola K14]|uniref:Class I SAM-dependent methyltransferase n=1 Tax=Waterburya agarophytonicola KI4 TaxID=2874699 RepID=A0A964BUE4_9CYAN|nr:class I SAM-dependent methyltransferase [Waterburya agarophytonicola]MCC0178100.1 class I SAM-dependent methyltransferase [Waterburya agarophytonicola KI4]
MNFKPLKQILVEKITNSFEGRITFAQYMALVLYHPEYGYYNSPEIVIGKGGDFFTSSSLGQDFGELLAIQLHQMWQNLGCPNPFYLVEMGAGNGQLAQDILNYFQFENNQLLIKALKYIIIEQSPALAIAQKKLLKSFTAFDLTWKTLSDIPDDSVVGCFFSNELVDAFPVHLVTKESGRLQEVYISLDREELTEIIYPISSDQISQYFDLVKIDLSDPQYPSNYRTEVNLNALNWLYIVSAKLRRGYILTIDYGYPANKYYRPSRDRGTLQCYFQHRRHNNPYANLGYQDITTHVDFTALEVQGESCNLETIGFTQQGLFLMALGLGDRLNDLSSGKYSISQIFQRRDALHQLIDPTGLGNFGVLIQGKNLTKSEKFLKGLTIPTI